ncbi:MAG: glycoside hydrolase family 2 [Verrucomicrobiales bacterium]|nr:glycoside hydrolase family 2 [Verrucomicrobiales bacterium]
MKRKLLGVGLLVVSLITGAVCSGGQGTASAPVNRSSTEPMMLDISPFFWEQFITPDRTNMELISVTGRQTFDGVPFQVDGRTHLYSRGLATARGKSRTAFPDMLGVKVGRAFDELHLLHATEWTDLEQETVARVRFNYADGTQHEFPILYGAHIRDWQRMQSEEKEIYTDPDTKVVWRGPGVAIYKSTTRLSKTRLNNPFPGKVVRTIDFVSNGKVASYNLAAATITSHDPQRPVTPPVPLDRPELDFNASLTVRVINEANQPIEGVLVCPSLSAAGSPATTVTTPLYTDDQGMGTVRYPKKESSCFLFFAYKDGWMSIHENPLVRLQTNNAASGQILVTIRMARDPSYRETQSASNPLSAKGIKSSGSKTTSIAGTSGAGSTTTVAATNSTSASQASQNNDPHPLLIIDFPVGSKVRVEASGDLGAKIWEEVTLFPSLPSSPYLFTCGKDCAPRPARFYRAVLVP